jgi:hypothetical protein
MVMLAGGAQHVLRVAAAMTATELAAKTNPWGVTLARCA